MSGGSDSRRVELLRKESWNPAHALQSSPSGSSADPGSPTREELPPSRMVFQRTPSELFRKSSQLQEHKAVAETNVNVRAAERKALLGLQDILNTPMVADWSGVWCRLVDLPDNMSEVWPRFAWGCAFTTHPWYLFVHSFATAYSTIVFVVVSSRYAAFGNTIIANLVAIVLLTLISPFHARVIKSEVWGKLETDQTPCVGVYELLDVQNHYLQDYFVKASLSRHHYRVRHKPPRLHRLEKTWIALMSLSVFAGVAYMISDNLVMFTAWKYPIGDWDDEDDELRNEYRGRLLFHYLTGCSLIYRIAMSMGAMVLANMSIAVMHCAQSNADILEATAERFDPMRLLSDQDYDAKARGIPIAEIKRDSFERYLLNIQFLNVSSDIWKTTLVLWLGFTAFAFFISCFQAFRGFINPVPLVTSVVFFFVPTYGVTSCNAAASGMMRHIRNATPDDHRLIGGKDEWVAMLNDVPAFWHIFGFALTPSWLAGFAGGAITTLAVLVIQTVVEDGG